MAFPSPLRFATYSLYFFCGLDGGAMSASGREPPFTVDPKKTCILARSIRERSLNLSTDVCISRSQVNSVPMVLSRGMD